MDRLPTRLAYAAVIPVELTTERLLLRQWRDEEPKRLTTIDRAIFSCAVLGHTWNINVGEPFCGVCGAPNLKPEAGA